MGWDVMGSGQSGPWYAHRESHCHRGSAAKEKEGGCCPCAQHAAPGAAASHCVFVPRCGRLTPSLLEELAEDAKG